MNRFVTFLIGHPLDKQRTEKCLHHLRNVGFSDITVVEGVPSESEKITSVDAAIARSHYNVVSAFVSRGIRKDLLILEDDVVFEARNASRLLDNVLFELNQLHSNWVSLHIGHIPMGPTFWFGNNLCWSLFPGTAHAYVLNGAKIKDYFLKLGPSNWRRPWIMEMQLSLPVFSKFSLIFPIANQKFRPKEMQKLDNLILVTKFFDYWELGTIVSFLCFVIFMIVPFWVACILRPRIAR